MLSISEQRSNMVTRELGGLTKIWLQENGALATTLIPQIIISRDLGKASVTPQTRPWFRPANVILRKYCKRCSLSFADEETTHLETILRHKCFWFLGLWRWKRGRLAWLLDRLGQGGGWQLLQNGRSVALGDRGEGGGRNLDITQSVRI